MSHSLENMDLEIKNLFRLIKQGQISPQEAARQIAELKSAASAPPKYPIFSHNEPLLRDHTIDGKQVLIGVAHASLALNSFFEWFPSENAVHLQKLNFVKPIELGTGERTEIAVESDRRLLPLDFKVQFRKAIAENWQPTATGRLDRSTLVLDKLGIAELKKSLTPYGDLSRIYSAGEPVFEVGQSFRTIRQLFHRGNEALAEVDLHAATRSQNREYHLHPLIIYSAFSALIPLLETAGFHGAFLPFGINSLHFRRGYSLEKGWVLVRLVKNSGEVVLFDVDLVTVDSDLVAQLRGCSIKRIRTSIEDHSAPAPRQAPAIARSAIDPDALATRIRNYLLGKLNLTSQSIDVNANLMELGLESAQLVELVRSIESDTRIELDPTLLFEYPNLRELTAFFVERHGSRFLELNGTLIKEDPKFLPPISSPVKPEPARTRSESPPELSNAVAVIGMHGQFAGAANLQEFWENLCDGKDVTGEVPNDHWDYRPWFHEDPSALDKTYCKWGSFIEGVDQFDPGFFNISSNEANWMDPQVRLLLQSVYATAEDAGVVNHLRGTATGVFVGICFNDYQDRIAELNLGVDPRRTGVGGAEIAANRISYWLDLKGPSLVLNTACSSSLFALHLACRSLRSGECEMAFVSGANLLLSSRHYRHFSATRALSPTGQCRPFDDAADGYIPGECVGTVLLKPLPDALRDGDPIHAVIEGSAALHGGHTPTLTAPSVTGEENVLLKAWKDARIDPATLSYIEAHGTGTKLGDSVELSALKKALSQFNVTENSCAVGSIKGNIGHAEGASGIAGLLKVILQLKHRKIPGLPRFAKLNDYARLDGSPLFIQSVLAEWDRANGPLRAGLSAFGFSGAYAHVVVTEPPNFPPAQQSVIAHGDVPIVLSAKSEERLREMAQNLSDFLSGADNLRLTDIAWTLQAGREAMSERLAFLAGSLESLKQKLALYLQSSTLSDDFFRGHVESAKSALTGLTADEDMMATIEVWIAKRKYRLLLKLWVQGFELDWTKFNRSTKPTHLSLPTYPFARDRFWIPDDALGGQGTKLSNPLPVVPAPEPESEWIFSVLNFGESFENPESQLSGAKKAALMIRQFIAQQLGIASAALDSEASFPELGVTSLGMVELVRTLGRSIENTISPSLLFDYTTISKLSEYLGNEFAAKFSRIVVRRKEVTHAKSLGDLASTCPLSEGQKGLWALQAAFPEMSAYNCPLSFRVHEALNCAFFQQACEFLLKQHPLLSAAIEVRDGQPFLIPQPETPFKLERIEAFDWDEVRVNQWIQHAIREPFDLTGGPLIRGTLLAISAKETVVVFTVHHIVFDGSSFGLFMQSLLQSYRLYREGLQPEVKSVTAGYHDFVLAENQRLTGKEGAEALAYWKEQLSGDLPQLDFPTDYPRSASQAFVGKTVSTSIPSDLGERTRAFARESGLFLSSIFLSLFKQLLHIYSGQNDIIVGMPVNERTEERFRPIIGYFVNILPIRSRRIGDQSFLDFTKTLQRTMVSAMACRYPFPALVRELGLSVKGRHPVFQAAFEYQNFVSSGDASEIQQGMDRTFPIKWVEGLHQEGEYEIALEIYEYGNEFRLNLKYNPTLLDVRTATRMAGQIRQLLEEVLDHPHNTPGPGSLVSTAERDLLLKQFNNTTADYPKEICIHEFFEKQAAATPNAIALVYKGRSLSYRELDDKSTQLALYLQSHGLQPDAIVGLCAERSFEMVIGILGVLKAGGAYLPLDPDYPEERLRFMVEDSKTTWILSQSHLAKASQIKGPGTTVFYLDTQWDEIAKYSRHSAGLKRAVGSRNLTYVLYTSGSTGNPKGVMVEHQALCNRIIWMQREYQLDIHDRVLQKTPYSFDVSGWEFHWPLMVGARLVLAEPGKHKDPEYLRDLIQAQLITVLHFVPSMIQAFLMAEGVERCQSLKHVFCSGEELTVQQKNLFFDRFENQKLHNLYGPTEAAIDVTYWPARKNAVRIPIGKPISNIQLYIVDSKLDLLPQGIPGELCIAGDGLARGYLNRPDLTADKFGENPFQPGSRLYRTGDLARWSVDGEIEYLGRIDHQVKIRGFRIELGEIEDALLQVDGIQEAVVVVHGEGAGKKLAGWYVASVLKDSATLRTHLKKRLPDYMVPSAFLRLDKIPLASSGKADRRTLSQKEVHFETANSDCKPRTATEERLANLWRGSLHRETLGVFDDFFELGGHSLLALDLISKINREFSVKLPLATLFETSRIADLAARLDSTNGPVSPLNLVGLQKSGSRPPLYFVPGIGGSSLSFIPLSRALGHDQPFYVFQPPGLQGECAPLDSIEFVAEFYVEQLLKQSFQGSWSLGGWSMGGLVALEMALQLEKRGISVDRLIMIDSYLQEHFDRFSSIASPSVSDQPTNRIPGNGHNDDQLKPARNGHIVVENPERRHGFAELSREYPELARWSGNAGSDAIQHLSEVVATNKRAIRGYQPGGVYRGEILYFYGAENGSVAGEKNKREPSAELHTRLERETCDIWGKYLPRVVSRFLPVEGSHYSILEEPGLVNYIAAEIRAFVNSGETSSVSPSASSKAKTSCVAV
jgi:amino acid adenylation domain-containing protein